MGKEGSEESSSEKRGLGVGKERETLASSPRIKRAGDSLAINERCLLLIATAIRLASPRVFSYLPPSILLAFHRVLESRARMLMIACHGLYLFHLICAPRVGPRVAARFRGGGLRVRSLHLLTRDQGSAVWILPFFSFFSLLLLFLLFFFCLFHSLLSQ